MFFINFYMILIVFLCFFSLCSFDPFKSCLMLILSLLFMTLFLSFGKYLWVSYFICLLFLSGIFVILIYFSSLSSFFFLNNNYIFFMMVFMFISIYIYLNFDFFYLLSFFYLNFFYLFFFFFIFCLFYFLFFVSFYLNFSGALRKF